MKVRIDLAGGSWRTIECDKWSIDGPLIRFTHEGQPVLTTILQNTVLIEPAPPEPRAQEPSHDLFSKKRG